MNEFSNFGMKNFYVTLGDRAKMVKGYFYDHNLPFSIRYSEESKPTSFCSVCGAKILPKSIFCFECGPPDPLKKEPEETGISLEQAVVRIAGLMFLFVCV